MHGRALQARCKRADPPDDAVPWVGWLRTAELRPQASWDGRQPVETLRWRCCGQASMAPAPSEDGEDLAAAPRGRGREDPAGTVAVAGLADRLRLRPLASARIEPLEPMRGEGAVGGEVDDVAEVDLHAPDGAREPSRGRDARLGRVPVPLCPDGRFRVAEVDRADDAAALPPTVGRLVGPEEGLGVDPGDPEPGPLDADARRDVRAQANDSFSSSATTFETSR
jgi:hypothetical protein